jgi:hypothetical protein
MKPGKHTSDIPTAVPDFKEKSLCQKHCVGRCFSQLKIHLSAQFLPYAFQNPKAQYPADCSVWINKFIMDNFLYQKGRSV